jgi:hypothetical protein
MLLAGKLARDLACRLYLQFDRWRRGQYWLTIALRIWRPKRRLKMLLRRARPSKKMGQLDMWGERLLERRRFGRPEQYEVAHQQSAARVIEAIELEVYQRLFLFLGEMCLSTTRPFTRAKWKWALVYLFTHNSGSLCSHQNMFTMGCILWGWPFISMHRL